MADVAPKIAIAWPTDLSMRAFLEALLEAPVPVWADTVEQACLRCDTKLAVPPKTMAAIKQGAQLHCLFCAMNVANEIGGDITIEALSGKESLNHKQVTQALQKKRRNGRNYRRAN